MKILEKPTQRDRRTSCGAAAARSLEAVPQYVTVTVIVSL